MNLQEAVIAMKEGHKVKLPEWTGYWFIEEGKTKVFTRTGNIVDTPHYDKYATRTDWEKTNGKLGFDFAVLAIKNGKKVRREQWHDDMYISSNDTITLSNDAIMAEDWQLYIP